MDSYKNFVTFQNADRTILKLNRKEAELLRPYFESEMRARHRHLREEVPVQAERSPCRWRPIPITKISPCARWACPALGALGVTFGYAIAMDSPSGRPPGSSIGHSTLWHEMSHVFTLTHDQLARAALVHRRPGGARGDRRLAGMGRPHHARKILDGHQE